MKIAYYIFLIFLLSCGGSNKNLVDLKSFTNQGEKIILIKQKNLNTTDVNKISNLQKTKYKVYKDWYL